MPESRSYEQIIDDLRAAARQGGEWADLMTEAADAIEELSDT